jgi:hypothetical protein
MAWTLCSKQDVTSIHNIAKSELKDFWSESVEALIREYTRLPFLGKPSAVLNELHDGDGTNTLKINVPPISSIQQLMVDGNSISEANYTFSGQIISLSTGTFTSGSHNVVVSYFTLTNVISNEQHDGDGTHILRVRYPPISRVILLQVDPYSPLDNAELNAYTFGSTDYLVFPTYIELRYGYIFPRGKLNIIVSYESAAHDVDPIVRLTAASMIVAFANYRGRMGADSSLKWGKEPSKKAGESSPNQEIGLTAHLNSIMRSMLKRGKVRIG